MPPKYDIVAKTNRNNHGVADFEAHAINSSGGTKQKTVYDNRKKEIITVAE